MSRWFDTEKEVFNIHDQCNPQSEALTWVAVAVIRPKNSAWPLVKLFNAASAMLNPFNATSMANTIKHGFLSKTDFFLRVRVKFHHWWCSH